jgi:hypothetical protein
MDVIETAKARYAELKAQIEAADAIRPDFERLREFLKTADEIKQQHLTRRRAAKDSIVSYVLQRPPAEDTSNMAEKVLDEFGPTLPILDIISRLREAGWRGSGDERKDYKNIYTTLSTKPKRFRNVGMATFERVKTTSEKSGRKG